MDFIFLQEAKAFKGRGRANLLTFWKCSSVHLSPCGHLSPCSDAKQCEEPCWSGLSGRKKELGTGELSGCWAASSRILSHLRGSGSPCTPARCCCSELHCLMPAQGCSRCCPAASCRLLLLRLFARFPLAKWECSKPQQWGSGLMLSLFLAFFLFHHFIAVPQSGRRISSSPCASPASLLRSLPR